jgi:Spy/CpxP family protein refolding chaperone
MLGPLGMLMPRLGLSDAQKDQIKGIMQAHSGDTKPLGERVATARRTLEDAITAGVVDESLIRQRSAELAAAQADLDVVRAHIFSEVFQLLTPDQQTQVRNMLSRIGTQGGRGRGRGNPPPNGN